MSRSRARARSICSPWIKAASSADSGIRRGAASRCSGSASHQLRRALHSGRAAAAVAPFPAGTAWQRRLAARLLEEQPFQRRRPPLQPGQTVIHQRGDSLDARLRFVRPTTAPGPEQGSVYGGQAGKASASAFRRRAPTAATLENHTAGRRPAAVRDLAGTDLLQCLEQPEMGIDAAKSRRSSSGRFSSASVPVLSV